MNDNTTKTVQIEMNVSYDDTTNQNKNLKILRYAFTYYIRI